MADINKELTQIKTAVYGKDVRGSIHDGIKKINTESEGSRSIANENKQRQDTLEQQFDDLQRDYSEANPSTAELVAARTNTETDENYNTIGRRMDAEYQKITSQLNDLANEYWASSFKDVINPAPLTPADFYQMVEGNTHPYVNLGSLGKDQSDEYNIRFWTYTPPNYKKTVLILGGIHGGEVYGTYFITKLFRMLMGLEELPVQFEFLKKEVRILSLPILNPWGMSQNPKVRYNVRGVDLNRNFDWRWDQQPDDPPFSLRYKGESPFSEKETQHMKWVLDRYRVDAFMDLHDFGVTDGRSFVFFPDPASEKFVEDFAKYWSSIHGDNGSIATTQNDASSNNYTSAVLGIPSVNVEGLPTQFGNRGSYEDVNANFEMYGNVLLSYARYTGDAEAVFSIRNLIKDYYEQILINSTTYKKIEDSEYKFTPNKDGYVSVSGSIIGKNSVSTDIFAVMPLLEQEGYIIQNKEQSVYLPMYSSGVYPIIPVNIVIPVKKGKEVRFNLSAMREGTGTTYVKRFNVSIVFNKSLDTGSVLDRHTFVNQ